MKWKILISKHENYVPRIKFIKNFKCLILLKKEEKKLTANNSSTKPQKIAQLS